MARVLLGLSVGSTLSGVDAAVVRAEGIGLALAPRIARTVRVPFSPEDRKADWGRGVAECAVQAARAAMAQSGLASREVFALGFLAPPHPPSDIRTSWSEVAARTAEATGLTVIHGFGARDRAAGGSGHPITALPDYFLFRDEKEDRLLIHLGAMSSILLAPAGAKVAELHGFEAGPGHRLLDAIVQHGTRAKETSDPHGKQAVQGMCLESLLARWLEHPYLSRKAPKAIGPDSFGQSFLLSAFEAARGLGAGLADLLCTASHFIARSIGAARRTLLPPTTSPPRILLTGGGVRNGFLLQLLAHQFEGAALARSDEVGIPSGSRKAAAAAILAALACDGVPGNLAPITGAAGGRILGQILPGDTRNWARCASWIAWQAGDPSLAHRVA